MQYGLNSSAIQKIQKIFSKFSQIDKVILYGSRAKGNFKNGSDIDLTLIGDLLDLKLLHKIEDELDELLLPYKIDLSLFNHIENENLINHINRVGLVFFKH